MVVVVAEGITASSFILSVFSEWSRLPSFGVAQTDSGLLPFAFTVDCGGKLGVFSVPPEVPPAGS